MDEKHEETKEAIENLNAELTEQMTELEATGCEFCAVTAQIFRNAEETCCQYLPLQFPGWRCFFRCFFFFRFFVVFFRPSGPASKQASKRASKQARKKSNGTSKQAIKQVRGLGFRV